MAWSDEEFLAEVQRRFGFRLGRFLKVGRRVPYPLSLTRASRTSAGRCVIIGNAAQGLHPVAGMGFNLGLRDVASLAELIAEHRREPHFDPGAAGLLADYDAWRAADRGGVIAFTDGLVRMFASPLGVVQAAAQVGTAGLRFVAAGKGRVVAPEHRSRRRHAHPEAGARRRAAMSASGSRDFDVVIVGAGVIGAVMARLLVARKLVAPGRVAMIADRFAAAPAAGHGLGFAGVRLEPRLGAAAQGLRRVGISAGEIGVFAYERMCVWDAAGHRGARFALTSIALKSAEPNLGFIVEGRALQWQCLQAARSRGAVLIEAELDCGGPPAMRMSPFD